MTPAANPAGPLPSPPPVCDLIASRAEGLITAMDDLGDVLRQEISCLKTLDFAGVRGLSDIKARLVRHYEEAVRRLRVEEEVLKAMPPDLRQRLQAATKIFRDTVDQNQSILRSALRASQIVVNTMVGTINSERALDGTYSNKGGLALARTYGRRTATVPPATYNQRC
jgi:hypothetical protein